MENTPVHKFVKPLSPSNVVIHVSDEHDRITDEVERINALLLERKPMSMQPLHFVQGAFQVHCPTGSDAYFMEKVAARFRDEGWEVIFAKSTDISGTKVYLVFKHESLSAIVTK